MKWTQSVKHNASQDMKYVKLSNSAAWVLKKRLLTVYRHKMCHTTDVDIDNRATLYSGSVVKCFKTQESHENYFEYHFVIPVLWGLLPKPSDITTQWRRGGGGQRKEKSSSALWAGLGQAWQGARIRPGQAASASLCQVSHFISLNIGCVSCWNTFKSYAQKVSHDARPKRKSGTGVPRRWGSWSEGRIWLS